MQVIFVPITKVDVEKREVWGRAAHEIPDKTKEVFDYETSAPLFRTWSDDFDKATDGKSLGNIRAMHGKVAAGKVTAISFDDSDKAIDIGTKIVDDAEWNKCLEGVYTGFSIGGSYEKKWKDGEFTRYTARPSEISLVDNPCIPTAKFQMVKADGVVEEVPFKIPAPAPDPAAVEKKDEPLPVTDPATPAAETAAPEVKTEVKAEAKKGMYDVSSMASLVSSIASLAQMSQFDADIEEDNSPVPAKLRSWLAAGLQILNELTAEESAELLEQITPKSDGSTVITMADKGDLKKFLDLTKAGARHSAADQKQVQNVHDASVMLGAGCSADGEKAVVTGDLTKITDDLAKVTTENETLKKRVAELEKEPAPAKGVQKVVVVGKEADVVDKAADLEDTSPMGLMKQAQRRPMLLTKS